MALFGLLNSKPGAIALLHDDHRKVKALFSAFEKAPDKSSQKRIAEQVIAELKVHATLEEEIFYPAVRKALRDQETTDLLDEALEEHHVAKLLIAELERLRPADERYKAKVTVLGESIKHHVREEESEMFPKAESAQIDLERLAELMKTRKQQLLRDPEATRDSSHPARRTGVGGRRRSTPARSGRTATTATKSRH